MKRIALVAGNSSYHTADFVEAAASLRLEPVIVGNGRLPAGHRGLEVCLTDVTATAQAIATIPRLAAVVALDDEGVLAAAAAGRRLGLPHNPPEAVAATRDKAVLRRALAQHGVHQPSSLSAGPGEVPVRARQLGFPVVVKPVGLAASRGVIRADSPDQATVAESRIRSILERAGLDRDESLLVEQYIPGTEIAVEGILGDGGLEVLAIIDKPDPLEGPFFEETLFITPSRHPGHVQEAAVRLVSRAVAAIGLEVGPIHAEVRIQPDGRCFVLEIAARTIGGLCGRAFSFGLLGEKLEVMALRSALRLPARDTRAARPASGVLMLPVPASGILTGVAGIDRAGAVPGIQDITITIPTGRRVEMLPEGDRYLGFVFATAPDPATVEEALRRAGNELQITIDGEEVRPAIARTATTDRTIRPI